MVAHPFEVLVAPLGVSRLALAPAIAPAGAALTLCWALALAALAVATAAAAVPAFALWFVLPRLADRGLKLHGGDFGLDFLRLRRDEIWG